MASDAAGGAVGAAELIVGGQRSGKSRCAEGRALGWLAGRPDRSALLIATALPADDEMRERIARHRADRSPRLPTLEVPIALPAAIRDESAPDRLLVVDCLTLWWTNLLMPAWGAAPAGASALADAEAALCAAIGAATGPLVLVGNEIGMGVAPLGRDARRFVDTLGRLQQSVAAACDAVTWMVVGIEVPVKRP